MISGSDPILSCADAQTWEDQLLGGDEAREWGAMTRAGRALGTGVLADALEMGGIPEEGRILVLCGKGHNGGDALIALHTILDARARAVARVLVVPDFAALRPLTRRALEDLHRMHASCVEYECVSGSADGDDAARIRRTVGEFDLCLDGLFGMQFKPPLRAPANWIIALINEHAGVRLRAAVDLPSGVGDANDAKPFRADFTYATGIAKAPLFLDANRAAVGRVRYLDLGFFDQKVPSLEDAALPSPSGASASSGPAPAAGSGRGTLPHSKDDEGSFVLTDRVLNPMRAPRDAQADKRTFGHLFVVSGSRTMPGAVLMAVESALVSGVGLVTAFVPESLAAAFAAHLPEAMWVPMPETLDGGLALEGRGSVVARAARCTGLLAGPGLGRDRESLTLIAEILRAIDVPAVLDGDALQPGIVTAHYPGSASARVLTPHAGEFARIAGTGARDDNALRAAAANFHAAVVFKGPLTRICDGGAVHVSPFGGPVLSRGGSGDILAGLIAGQLAQGVPALEAAVRGVVWHGRAADRLASVTGQTSARVTGLAAHLPHVLRERTVTGASRDRGTGPASTRPATTDGERE